MRDHEDRGTDQAAVEPPRPAEHEHDHQLGRAREAQPVDADELRRLGEQARRRRRRSRRRCVKIVTQALRAPARRSPASACRPRVCRAGEARTARRRAGATSRTARNSDDQAVDDTPCCRPRSKSRRLRGSCRIVTPDSPSTPPVIDDALFAASNSISPMPSVTIRRVRSLPRTTRKLASEAGDRRDRGCGDETAERLAPAVHGEQPRGIRADAEECGVPERDDAGVTEDQVERHREQPGDQDLAAQRPGSPETRRSRSPAAARMQPRAGATARREASHRRRPQPWQCREPQHRSCLRP